MGASDDEADLSMPLTNEASVGAPYKLADLVHTSVTGGPYR
jgi:hypothetical protein